MKSFMDFLDEAFEIKVNYQGKKRKKLSCPPGYKPNPEGTACVPMTADQKHDLKLGAKQAVRTKRAEGASLKKKQMIRTKRAMKFRQKLGL